METRAGYLLVGVIVLVVVLAAVAWVFWLTHGDARRSFDFYDIHFRGSISGLGVGGDVRYRGIKVGSITNITIDPNDPEQAAVTVQIDSDVPIREGDVAAVQVQGITGIAYINIAGATGDSPPLTSEDRKKYPVIPSLPSNFEQLFTDAPEMIANANVLLTRLADVVSDENRTRIATILDNLETLSAALATSTQHIDTIMTSFARTSEELAAAATGVNELTGDARALVGRLNTVVDNVDDVVTDDAKLLVNEFREAADSVQQLAETAERILRANEQGLEDFTTTGVGEFIRFLNEARVMLNGLTRLVERIEAQGARVFLGQQRPELRAE